MYGTVYAYLFVSVTVQHISDWFIMSMLIRGKALLIVFLPLFEIFDFIKSHIGDVKQHCFYTVQSRIVQLCLMFIFIIMTLVFIS